MKRLTLAVFGVFAAALITSGLGCELITAPDRTKIAAGGTGGEATTTGGGGTGGSTGGTNTTGGGGTGGGTPCTTIAQCPDTGNECVLKTCVDNLCGTEVAPEGTLGADQMTGDCRVFKCNDSGTLEALEDNADLPVDGDECTDDVCTAGEPSNPFTAEGAPCGANQTLQCDGAGQCVNCLDASDCGVDDECKTFTCDAGVCGQMNENQGTALADQNDGDCKVDQCDGAGEVETVDDNMDVPVDDTACTDDICAAGVPSNPPVASGATCSEGSGILCDGSGACVECIVPGDCLGADDECQTRTCNMGVCGVDFAPMGTGLISQTGGDCQKVVCDGAGGITSADDNLDLPNDNNPCTGDACVAGAPDHPFLPLGTGCGGTLVCNAVGQCQGCNVGADCQGSDDECKTRTCNGGTCGFIFTNAGTAVAMQTSGDCKKNVCDGSGNIVNQNDNADLPADDGQQCTDEVCNAGSPAHPAKAVNTACNQGGGLFCSAAGACVQCNAAAQCPGTDDECKARTCNSNACGFNFQANGFQTPTQVPGDCKVRQCDGAGNFIQANANANLPADDGQQCTDEVCNAGTPAHPPKAINTACNQGGGLFCTAVGTCVQCNAPAQCSGVDNDCQTKTCSSNTCGFNFQPNGTPTSMQTPGDCKENQCNGAGVSVPVNKNTDLPVDGNQCTNDVCTAGTPSNPNAMAGTTCNQMGGTVCNGMGVCIGAGCGNMVKDGTETGVDCGGGMCPPCAAGGACNVPADCASAVCTGMICQAPACNDTVKNGNETGVDCGGGMCPLCAAGGGCNGPSDCLSGVCTGNICQAPACNDTVKNGSETGVDCGGGMCPTCGLGQACGGDGDCTSGHCVGNVCVECVTAATCPGMDNECQTRTCNSNACGFSFTMPGFVTGMQTPGDCLENQCDGAGNIVPVNKDTDLPADDANQCTGEACSMGTPQHPALPVGTTCSQMGGTACNGAGACVLPPAVASTAPADGAGSVSALTTVAITFTKAMNPATLTAQTTVGACSGSIQVSLDNFASCIPFASAAPSMNGPNTIATLTPSPALNFGTTYKIKVLGTVADAVGLTMGTDFTTSTGFGTRLDAAWGQGVVISQIFGGGGSGATVPNADYVELHNRGTSAVTMTNWSVQYASSAGSSWTVVPFTGTIQPGAYFLIRTQNTQATGTALPTPDATGTAINMAQAAGKLALVNNNTTITSGTLCPTGATIVDFIGFGSQVPATGCWETLPAGGTAPAPSATTAEFRLGNGCGDDNNNSTDFTVGTPAPRNSMTTAFTCSVSVNEKNIGAELDYCNVQFPLSLNVSAGATTPTIYAQAYEAGVTDPAGPAVNLVANIGYGPTNVNPETQSGWTWTAATFNQNQGNNDEWQVQLTAPAQGTYRYGARFSFDGIQWTYCNLNGAGSNAGLSFDVGGLPTMTVNP